MTNNPTRPNFDKHGTLPLQKLAQVVDVKNDIDIDGQPRFRVKVRVYGDQKDEIMIPDENLQWIRVEHDVTNKGGTPYMKPGMMVRCNDMGGTPGTYGMGPYISSVVSYNPTAPENGQGIKVASTQKTAQPRTDADTYPYSKYEQSQDPIKNTTTQASNIQDVSIQETEQKPKDKAIQKKNRFDQTDAKWTAV